METTRSFSQDINDEYQKFIRRMNPPRVVIDNETCKNATVIQVDSANKHGILLEVVQVLTDLNLIITKAYISSDGGWFMDVFNVTDQSGSKITDEEVLGYIQKNFFLMESIFIFHSKCWKILHTSPTLCQILTNCFAHFMRIVALLVYVVNQYKVAGILFWLVEFEVASAVQTANEMASLCGLVDNPYWCMEKNFPFRIELI